MKRRLEHGREEILSNKKIKYDNQQDVSTNEASSHTDDEKNFKEKESLSDKDENVSESSSEGIEYNTDLNSSSSSETKVEDKSTVKGSTKLSLNNLETTKSGSDINEIVNNSIKVNQHLLEKNIKNHMATLQKGVEDKTTCDHIIASILEIYTEHRNYTEVLNQIVEDVEGIEGDKDTFETLCCLAISLTGYNRGKSDIYISEVPQDKEELGDLLAGKVYDSICDIYYIE